MNDQPRPDSVSRNLTDQSQSEKAAAAIGFQHVIHGDEAVVGPSSGQAGQTASTPLSSQQQEDSGVDNMDMLLMSEEDEEDRATVGSQAAEGGGTTSGLDRWSDGSDAADLIELDPDVRKGTPGS